MSTGNLFEEDNEYWKSNENLSLDYYELSRLAFIINRDSVGFHCSCDPADKDNFLFKPEVEIKQSFKGWSEPICGNQYLAKKVYDRQPFVNQIFEGKRILLNIIEKKSDDMTRSIKPYYISIYRTKNEFSLTLTWFINDRSLFTRLVSVLSSYSKVIFQIRLSNKDFYFKKFVDNLETDLPNIIGVEGLTFNTPVNLIGN